MHLYSGSINKKNYIVQANVNFIDNIGIYFELLLFANEKACILFYS